MTPPRISVLLPCYNDGAFVDEAIQSVLAQTCQDFEIVMVDDGSTDSATVQKLASCRLPRVRVLRTGNQGLPAARNHAARHAEGQVFCALDADDRLAPAWFEKGLAALDADPALGFASHWLETFGDEQWTWTPTSCDLPALLARNTVNGAALVRREAFESVGGYDEAMRGGCEDWDFWLRLVEGGWAGTIVPEVLFFYRRRAESMSRLMLGEAAYRAPLSTLLAKHEGAYRDHLLDVVLAQEAESMHLAREIASVERGLLLEIDPALRRAREELGAAAAKAARVRAGKEQEEELIRLRHHTAAMQSEIAALRASLTWRLSAPFRALYDLAMRSGR